MSIVGRYAEAQFPDPVRILGRTLQPFCIGHALLLHRLGNPFLDDKVNDPGVGDLLEGLYVCSRPWKCAYAGIHKIRTRYLLKIWQWQIRKVEADPAVELAKAQFFNYLNLAWRGPNVWEEHRTAEDRTPGAPLLAWLNVSLASAFGWSKEQCLSTPVVLAIHDLVFYLEGQGKMSIVSDEDVESIEEAVGL